MKQIIEKNPVLFSCMGAACLFGTRLLPTGKDAPLWSPFVGLAMAALGLFALWNAFRVRRQARAVEVADTFSDEKVTSVPTITLTRSQRILGLIILTALGAVGAHYSWVLYIAGLGAVAYTGTVIYTNLNARRSSAAMLPFTAIPLLGGCAIFILIGVVIGAIAFH